MGKANKINSVELVLSTQSSSGGTTVTVEINSNGSWSTIYTYGPGAQIAKKTQTINGPWTNVTAIKATMSAASAVGGRCENWEFRGLGPENVAGQVITFF